MTRTTVGATRVGTPGRPGTRPTIRDVAAAAGVSATTVSHALNGKGRVDPETRARVREIADAVGYVPNPTARSLRMGRTLTFGIALPAVPHGNTRQVVSSGWYGRLAVACAHAAAQRQHALLVLPRLESVADLQRSSVDGVIVVDPGPASHRLQLALDARMPVVTLDSDPERTDVPHVVPDTARGTEALMGHLAQQGARRVLLLEPQPPLSWVRRAAPRIPAWETAFGLTIERLPVDLHGADDPAAADRCARDAAVARLRTDPPDAVVGMMGDWGVAALDAAHHLGLSVPRDLLVAQDIDTAVAASAAVSLTALDLQPLAMADAVVTLLHELLAGGGETRVMTPVEVVQRATTTRT